MQVHLPDERHQAGDGAGAHGDQRGEVREREGPVLLACSDGVRQNVNRNLVSYKFLVSSNINKCTINIT